MVDIKAGISCDQIVANDIGKQTRFRSLEVSPMGNPNVHDHINLPIIVAGGSGCGMKGGQHIRFEKPTPLANLHLTLLDKAGVRLDKFADSNGVVSEVLA